MKKPNYEDFIMKRAMDIFVDEGLKFFGIHKKVIENGPTELVVLDSKNMYMDYTFLMEDDSYIHFEFQTTNKGVEDLMRFRTYESLLNHQSKKQVTTYVVYSGDIKNSISEYDCGINTYKVHAISMSNEDGDKVFDEIIDKLSKGKDIDKHDIIKLTFTPIMGGKMDKKDKILKAIRITKDINSSYKRDIESILYAFANKFLSGKDLEQVKEELRVTEIGKSLIEEGIQKGKIEGERKKAMEIAKSLLDVLSIEMIANKTGLTVEEVQSLKEDNK
ncbi:hypothetical protein SDC9_79002 [bioreactor metagenome]|uniref:Transposase (putative) YhgA-like domain-containing protein n=1 Tax=bioreactor metagenome TaxID=1076179 RepID=A0A644YV02_9ZZZZ